MFHRYFAESYKPGCSLGEMMVQTQHKYIESFNWDRVTIDEFNLIGDPSLKIGGYQ